MAAKINVDLEKFKRLYARDLSDEEIAESPGFLSQTARNIRNDMGLPLQPKQHFRINEEKKHSRTNEAEFLVYYQQGKSTKEIANELHVTYDYLRRWMKKHNYRFNRPKFARKAMMPAHKQIELETYLKNGLNYTIKACRALKSRPGQASRRTYQHSCTKTNCRTLPIPKIRRRTNLRK